MKRHCKDITIELPQEVIDELVELGVLTEESLG